MTKAERRQLLGTTSIIGPAARVKHFETPGIRIY